MVKFLIVFVLFFWQITALDAATLIVLRHGEGEHNLLQVISTWTKEEGGADHSLTAKGKDQVSKTAQKLLKQGINQETVGLVLVSPLQRTRQTAQILVNYGICSEKTIQIEERIREPVAKDWEGNFFDDFHSLCPELEKWSNRTRDSAQHGGESQKSVQKRIESVLDQLSEWKSVNGHIILVTHGFPSQILFELLEITLQLKTAEAKILNWDSPKRQH